LEGIIQMEAVQVALQMTLQGPVQMASLGSGCDAAQHRG
jgi:hypothetical protein